MPGSVWQLECTGCGFDVEIATGASLCWDCKREPGQESATWHFEQMLCPACRTLVSVRAHDPACRHIRTQRRCRSCRTELEPWAGEVGFRPVPEAYFPDSDEEFVAGPCPRCAAALEGQPGILWD